ncbi:MAG: YbbR-like domain-containing protein [Oligoflexales bacterium]
MKKLLQKIFYNFWFKVFSLFLALLVWGLIQGEQVLEIHRDVNVNLHAPEGYLIKGDSQRAIAATLRGPRLLLLEAPATLEVDILVPPLKGKNYRIRIDKGNFRSWDDRIQLTIHDPYLSVFVDENSSRTVPVKYVPFGTPADGYFIKKVVVNPNWVKITGLKTELAKVREVVTEPIDIEGIQQNQTLDVALIPPPGFQATDLAVSSVSVNLEVGDSFVNKRFGGIPIEVTGGDFQASVRPKFASIVIQGTPGVLKFVRKEDLKAFVEARGLGPGQYEGEIKVKIPPETVLIEAFPEKGTLIIENKRLP